MSMITCTIGGNAVSVKNGSFSVEKVLENRSILKFTVQDALGAYNFTRGQQVVFSDSAMGILYRGFVNTSEPIRLGIASAFVEHAVTCMDRKYWLDKRTNSKNYLGWYAGNVAVDFIDTTLASEGVTAPYATNRDTTTADFNAGTNSGLAGYSSLTSDGDLELARAGSDLIILETTTADFATGTLTSMTATANALVPTTQSALKMQSTLSFAYGVEFAQAQQTASGTTSGSVSGSASGTISTSASYTPSGSISISSGSPGESASFFGFGGSISPTGFNTLSVSGSTSGSVSASVSAPYQPKQRSKVKVDATHYGIITVDRAVADNRVDSTIWTGSITLGSSDTLNYDIWISSSSPSQEGGIDLVFSDGTTLTEYLGSLKTNFDVGVWDQNLVSVSPIQDLSDYAKDTWYTRNIDLSLLSGKTITSVTLFTASNLAGTFDLYIKNCYLTSHSGSPFFSTTSTTPAVNPPTVASIGAYITAATLTTVVTVYNPSLSERVSPAHSIDSVKLVKDSLITWSASNPVTGPAVIAGSPGAATVAGNEAIFVSYDGTTWLPCTNHQALPGLPVGANVAGLSLYLLETFTGGQDPTAIPSMQDLTINLYSAPNATTTDTTGIYGSSTTWNSGTEQGVAPNSSGDLILSNTSYSWSNTNHMTYVPGNSSSSNPTQSTSSGAYQISSSGSSGTSWSSSRFNFISAALDFACEADFTLNGGSSPHQNEIGFVYRQTYWGSPNNSFAYYVRVMQAPGGQAGGTGVTLGCGVNNPSSGGGPSSGPFTSIVQRLITISNSTTYHLKLVVSGNRHTVYWNGSSSPIIDVLDNTYTAAGNIGIRTYVDSSNSCTAKIANFVCSNTFAGLWTSPSISLSSLGTVGETQISWAEVAVNGNIQNTAIVQASLDGGATYQQCTNGALVPTAVIPGLPVGTNVSGKSLKLQVILSTTSFLTAPIIMGLYVRVCGAYPGSSGTRSTAPIGNDMQIARTSASSWLSAFDGQTWAKIGTATVAVGSGVETIVNTTGDLHMRLGPIVGGDMEGTVRFMLSASGIVGGIELRYVDTNNFYRLQYSTTAVSIIKKIAGVVTVLASLSMAISTGVQYRARFRIVGSSPIVFFGNVWPDGTLEPTIDPTTYQWNNSPWTIVATD